LTIPQNTTKGSTYAPVIEENTLGLDLSGYAFGRIVTVSEHRLCRAQQVFKPFKCRRWSCKRPENSSMIGKA